MKLARDWKKVLKHAWSVRLMALGVALQVLDAAMPYLPAIIPAYPGVLLLFSIASILGGLISRFIAQKTVSGEDE